LQVTSAEGGQEIGKITKQWAGFVREYFTSADQFGVSCKRLDVLVFSLQFILNSWESKGYWRMKADEIERLGNPPPSPCRLPGTFNGERQG